MAKKFDAIDVVKMRATLTLKQWENALRTATKSNNTDKLLKYRYGLQAGLADASKKGLADDALCVWVLQRIKNVELCMRHIVRKRNPNPLDIPGASNPELQLRRSIEVKRKRDYELEQFLLKSNY